MPTQRTYLALLQRLATLPLEEERSTLSEPEREVLIGPQLLFMRTRSSWRNGAVARINWRFDGFDAQLDRLGQTVTFTRRHNGTPTAMVSAFGRNSVNQ